MSTKPSKRITLLTDFGTQDGYVAAMKGVIYGICPEAVLVDMSHEVQPQDIDAGAFLLSAHTRYFPAGTVHLAVVDPGVGSARAIVLACADGQYFLAPDNGLLDFLAERSDVRFYAANNPEYWLAEISGTFHGRDIFAPLAAHLACGVEISKMFRPHKNIVRSEKPLATQAGDALQGTVVYVDRFGNLTTNIPARWLKSSHSESVVTLGDTVIGKILHHYSEKKTGEILAIIGSFGYIEIAVRNGSAAELFPDYRLREVFVIRQD